MLENKHFWSPAWSPFDTRHFKIWFITTLPFKGPLPKVALVLQFIVTNRKSLHWAYKTQKGLSQCKVRRLALATRRVPPQDRVGGTQTLKLKCVKSCVSCAKISRSVDQKNDTQTFGKVPTTIEIAFECHFTLIERGTEDSKRVQRYSTCVGRPPGGEKLVT